MNLTVIRTKDWVSIAEEDMGIRVAGTDYISAFTAFGFAIQSHELVLDKWDKQFEQDVLSGKLDRLSEEAIKEHRSAIVEQQSSKTDPTHDSIDGQSSEEKPRVGRPRAKNILSGAQRKKLWKQRHGEDALKKEREYQRDYRKRRKATRKYYLEDGKTRKVNNESA